MQKSNKQDKDKKVVRNSIVATATAVVLLAGGIWIIPKGLDAVADTGAENQTVTAKTDAGKLTIEDQIKEGKEVKDGLYNVTTGDVDSLLKEKGTEILYIGRPTCPHCQAYRPIQDKVLKDLGETIAYYNTDDARKAGEKEFIEVLDKLEVATVPTVLKVQDGVVVEKLDDASYFDTTGAGLKTWLQENK